ncbi:response regulator [Paenibacillus sp. GCM10027629]|uniref:response regulator n=1 Tax=Paenibacillus sp. GCM10027629 TaxID=3273414 RepID=UPI0036314E04
MRIVVIEDEDNTRHGIIKLINKLGGRYEIVGEADNGETGMRLIEDTRPDLVIADIKMPQLSGIEMLELLRLKGHRHKTVILTGFSEFEYAKKALQLGVFEFLEKPITALDLKMTLEKVEQELVLQQIAGMPAGHATAQFEHLLYRLVTNGDLAITLLPTLTAQVIDFSSGTPVYIVSVYLGKAYEAAQTLLKLHLSEWLGRIGNHAVITVPQEQSLVAILQGCLNGADVNRLLLQELLPALRAVEPRAVISSTEIPGLANLKACFDSLTASRHWFIVLNGAHTILNDQHIASLKVETLPFPHSLENKVKVAISEKNLDQIKRYFEDWLQNCFSRLYDPRHIIDVSVRLVSSTLQMIGEMYGDEWVYQYQKEWLHPILAAQTKVELIDAFESIAVSMSKIGLASPSIPYSLIVQKTMRIIHEQFQEGITLEEVASSLRITPEYLSGLFTKEVKSNFSAYVKNYRIKQSKSLLLKPQLKIFEISQMVGYSDPKYFSRVFKEVTGLSPAEYRNMNI